MKTRGMFTLVVLVALVACLISACIDSTPPSQPSASETPGTGITWYSYDEGMKIAQEQNKPVMIDIYADGCPHCIYLDRAFADPRIVELTDTFVCIKVHRDRRRDLAAKYNPSGGVPTVVFLHADDTEVYRFIGCPRAGAIEFVHDEMTVALSKV
uniref:Thiol:disulfide interchange protein DsbD n=1 Tax=Candidatus Methanogaster sp. ANME-2c ERB4 TaxID=2759911 RepID=A0A7G9YI98_9EURY|nr:thiol:disulfide interchange protein DsbD [Methanosarcinales archaeon ANME-2c ERB4]